jgi:hypothetical protein
VFPNDVDTRRRPQNPDGAIPIEIVELGAELLNTAKLRSQSVPGIPVSVTEQQKQRIEREIQIPEWGSGQEVKEVQVFSPSFTPLNDRPQPNGEGLQLSKDHGFHHPGKQL